VSPATVRTVRYSTVPSPFGELLLVGDGTALTAISVPGQRRGAVVGTDWIHDPGPFSAATNQLTAYFDGALASFDLPVNPRGTPFQRDVWTALAGIPYGTTVTYGELARRLGVPRAVRAVAAGVGANPLLIVVPCHRVIGADGQLTGYAGGLDRKAWLLVLESGARTGWDADR
jgi:methylated-DNA-[protein]-cysteine S-methyltransferase